ncbi:uncharacterized protein LOC113209941 [Frankliniella occidentalis]|uniref:Uncharacterized protein LOC113209941 n=1 Tax=Frankliniella occidentalis TaxID=133901 RepID=A0A9C6X0C9_FRAOC|nr:uncharacterized protein LOC113209941 [Frankliniella occidentalis]
MRGCVWCCSVVNVELAYVYRLYRRLCIVLGLCVFVFVLESAEKIKVRNMAPLYLCPLSLLSQLWGAVSWKAMELCYWLAKYQQTMAVVHQMLYLVIALGMVVPLHFTPWILFIFGISILTLSTYSEDVAEKLLQYTSVTFPTIQALTTTTLLSVMIRNTQERLCLSS